MPARKKNASNQAPAAAARTRGADAETPAASPKKRGRPPKPDPEDEEAEEAAAPPKKRGRPPKAPVAKAIPEDDEADEPKVAPRKRGRPSKVAKPEPSDDEDGEGEAAAPPSKKRGRPPKAKPEPAEGEDVDGEPAAAPPKKRGRPSKVAMPDPSEPEDDEEEVAAAPPKKRGRPAKAKPAPAVPETEAPPRKRGRPPKGGQTTKIAADADAAADQLTVELEEAAREEGKDVQASVRNFWLMKAEQEDRFETAKNGTQINTKFTIDDLRSKDEPEPWDGVRNPVAANNMRAMRKGDMAFFYASGGKAGRSPGITGIMEIVSEAEQDPTVSDEGAYGYVEKEADRKRWVIVKVEFRKKLSKPVSLKELQTYGKPSGVLEDMQLFKQTRLSVGKVTEKQWNFIVDQLIEGYDDGE